MTVNTETDRNLYDGTGAQFVFPYTFPVLQNADLEVRLVASDGSYTVAVLDTDYTMSGAGTDEGGEVEFILSAPSVGQQVLLIRLIGYLQPTDFKNQGRFFPRTHERSFDRVTMQAIRLSNGLARAIKVPEFTEDFDSTLPAPTADYVFVINPTGNGVTLVPASTFASLGEDFLQAGTGAQVRTVQSKLRDTVSVRDFGAVGDGATNDTTAFSEALATGKRVYVPGSATAYKVDNLTIPDGAVLFGDGADSKIAPFTVGAGDVLTLGSGANDIEIYGLTFVVDPATYTAKEVIGGGNNERVTLRDLHFVGGGAYAINIANQSQAIIQRVRVDGVRQSGILLFTADQCQISDCIVRMESGLLAAIEIYNGLLCKISGCNVEKAGVFGLHFVNCQYCTMSDNTTWNTDREGINLEDSSNCLVSNNAVAWNGTQSIDFGISVYAQTVASSYNSIVGNVILRPFKSGITLDGSLFAVAGTHISGNRVYGCNIENAATGAGVLLFGANVTNTHVSDNLIDGTVGSLKYGVNAGGASTLSSIRNNRVINAATGIIAKDTGIVALNGASPTAWVPTVVPGSGTITTLGTVSCDYYELETLVFFRASVVITTNGTAATTIIVTLPFAASGSYTMSGKETAVTGLMLQGSITSGSSNLVITKYDATYPGGNGHTLIMSGWYRRA